MWLLKNRASLLHANLLFRDSWRSLHLAIKGVEYFLVPDNDLSFRFNHCYLESHYGCDMVVKL